MFGPDHFGRLLWTSYDTLRRHATRDRKGVINEVKEGGGERKARAIVGYTRFGEPVLSPWMSSEENRSGDHRSEDMLKKGQNVSLSGWELAQSTMTPSAESKHAPRPSHAKLNADTESYGKKLRSSHSIPDQNQSQTGSPAGGQGGGSGGGGFASTFGAGAGGSGGSDGHMHEMWVSDQEEKLDEYQEAKGSFGSLGGGAGGAAGGAAGNTGAGGAGGAGGGGQQKEKPKVRMAISEKGAGDKHTWGAHVGEGKDEDPRVQVSEDGAKLRVKDGAYWIDKEGQLYTSKPPKIKKDGLPNDKYKSSQSGGQ